MSSNGVFPCPSELETVCTQDSILLCQFALQCFCIGVVVAWHGHAVTFQHLYPPSWHLAEVYHVATVSIMFYWACVNPYSSGSDKDWILAHAYDGQREWSGCRKVPWANLFFRQDCVRAGLIFLRFTLLTVCSAQVLSVLFLAVSGLLWFACQWQTSRLVPQQAENPSSNTFI